MRKAEGQHVQWNRLESNRIVDLMVCGWKAKHRQTERVAGDVLHDLHAVRLGLRLLEADRCVRLGLEIF